MKSFSILFLLVLASVVQSAANGPNYFANRQYFEIKVYHASTTDQVNQIKTYLTQVLAPAMRRHGVKNVGVFEAIANDTATDKRVFLFAPYSSFEDVGKLPAKLNSDKAYQEAGKDFLGATYDKAPMARIESIILYAFEFMPQAAKPSLTGNLSDRVYELRSYESATQNLHVNKVQMFNQGGEITLFKRLGFNAVFYGSVVVGSKMPNLMYMTSFDNMQSRTDHWKSFVDDPEWKKLSSMAEYKNNVSHIDIYMLRPIEGSDF
jgi:NIPSNAP protein